MIGRKADGAMQLAAQLEAAQQIGVLVESKSAFAERIGVHPSRITQMISAGIIGPDALIGRGRSARILVDLARQQIKARRHPGQALSNGLETRLDDPLPTLPDSAQGASTRARPYASTGTLSAQILDERLEQERRRNRLGAVEEARLGLALVLTADAEAAMANAVSAARQGFMEMAPAIADAVAARFGVDRLGLEEITRRYFEDASSRAEQTPLPKIGKVV